MENLWLCAVLRFSCGGTSQPGRALQPVVVVMVLVVVVVVISSVRRECEVIICGCAAKPWRCSRIVCDPAIDSVPPSLTLSPCYRVCAPLR